MLSKALLTKSKVSAPFVTDKSTSSKDTSMPFS